MSDPNQSWKSHFSVSSLLPARHPPLHVNHPTPPTRRVPGYHTTTDTLQCPSPIRSAYASPSVYPETPYGHYGLETGRMSNLPPWRHAERRPVPKAVSPAEPSPTKKQKHRPPPLNIAKINAVYQFPSERAVNDASPPRRQGAGARARSVTPPVSPPILPPMEGGIGGGMSRWKALAEARNMLEGGSKKAAAVSNTDTLEQEEALRGNGAGNKGTMKKPRKAERHDITSDDPFDIAFVEPGLQYPSWHAPPIPTYSQPGQSSHLLAETESERRARNLQNLQPGQVVPRHVLDSYHGKSAARSERDTVAGETYESVLHDVLLTPTYLRETPSPRSLLSSDPADRNGRYGSRFGRSRAVGARETLMAKAKRASRAPLALLGKRYASERDGYGTSKNGGSDVRSVSGSTRAMRAREEAEMDRFRRARPLMLGSTASFDSAEVSPTRAPGRGRGQGRNEYEADGRTRSSSVGKKRERERSRERYDEEAKVEYHQHHAYYNAAPLPSKQALIEWDREKSRREEEKARGSCWTFNITKGMDPKKVKKQQRKRKICIVLLILLLVGAVVGICLAFLLRRPASSSSSTPRSGSGPSSSPSATDSSDPSASPAASPSASTPTASPSASPPSRLQTCISQYASLTGDTSSYPCSECVPLLLATTNDFTQDPGSSNGNNTGVGAALQFCTLRDIVGAGDAAAFGADGGVGWGERDVCRWIGVQCDARGRIEEVTLSYPAVPYRIPTTISQIPTLKKVSITGNSSVPSGPFPSQLVTSTLTSLTLTDTALQGPIASAPWAGAAELTTLYLANNPILGSGIPDLKGNGKLVTLAMTGQLIGSVDVGKLPGSLTYLDLSYNSLTEQVPSFAELSSLQTLYLEHNSYTSPPTALPPSLRDLRLNNNPSLSGSMPSQVCGMSSLGECDLRGTGMGGNGTSCGSCRFGSG